MRIESSVTSISWIPSEAVEGLPKLPFTFGVAHYDDPPPDRVDQIETMHRADLFRELGEPELGFLFICSSDFGIYEAFPGVRLERTQTIMEGASHCDFRYRFLAQPSGEEETKSERPARPPVVGR